MSGSTDIQTKILKNYKHLKWKKPELKNECENSKRKFALNNTQQFVSKYLTPETENGILLYHSVGSGKTLSAIAIVKQFMNKGFNCVWITRTTLKKDLDKGLALLPLPKPFPVYSYKQWSNICKRKGENYNSLLAKAKAKNSATTDPFYKTIVIVDEAHKLYTKDLKPQELHDISKIQECIFNSYSVSKENRMRLVLMSGTPLTEDPLELVQLLNLLLVQESKRINVGNFSLTSNSEIQDFRNKTKDLVSYIDSSLDPSKFARVKYSEVLVGISKEGDKGGENCKDVYKNCKTAGFSQDDCSKAKKKCEFVNKVVVDLRGKSQEAVLKKRCGLEI
jgi:hypothetical protein